MSDQPNPTGTIHCAFCGHAEPVGPEPNRQMADHIVGCEKHPLRAAAQQNARLRAACRLALAVIEEIVPTQLDGRDELLSVLRDAIARQEGGAS